MTQVVTEKSQISCRPPLHIATIGDDGTLWCEQPMYVQAFFVFDRVKQLAATNPELKLKQPYRAILEDDQATVTRFGSHEIVALIAATHSSMTPEEFERMVSAGSIKRGTRDSNASTRNASISPSSSY